MLTDYHPLDDWPRPPAALPHHRLSDPPNGARETVARLLRVTGRLQRDNEVVHVVAEVIEDISDLLDTLLAPETRRRLMPAPARPDEGP